MIETLAGMIVAAGHTLPPPIMRDASLENPKTPLHAIFDVEPHGGRSITQQVALQSSTMWACLRYIAGSCAKLPFLTYRRTPEGRERAQGHYSEWLLQYQSNPAMTAYRFRHLMTMWLLIHGNTYAWMDINLRGQVTGLYPMAPNRVMIKITPAGLRYVYTSDSGGQVEFDGGEVLHLRWMSTDGIMGNSPIAIHRGLIGHDLDLRETGAKFFRGGMQISGVLSAPSKLSDVARKNIESGLERYKGLTNAWKVLLLEEGMKYDAMQSTMKDAQYLESANLTAEDIARVYGVPQHIVGLLARSTNNNIEHQGLEAKTVTLDEHLRCWETEVEYSLLSERDRAIYYVRHNTGALMRGDTKTRYEAYALALQNGWLTINEVREYEELNGVDGGDQPRTQMQMVPLGWTPPAPQKQIGGGNAA